MCQVDTNNINKKLGDQILRTDYLPPEKWWKRPKFALVEPLYFFSVVVPAGFITDMGTIPRSLWFLFDPINRYGHATVVHDFALTYMSRKMADKLFKEALIELNVKGWRVRSMYRAVRVFGMIKEAIIYIKSLISKKV